MFSKLSGFLRLNRDLPRRTYAIVGVILASIKYNLDRFVARAYFDESWSPMSYLYPSEDRSILQLTPAEQEFYLTMVIVSVPFLLVGLWLTVRRLRSIALPQWLVVLFFAPVVNLLFFVILSVLPSGLRPRQAETQADDVEKKSSDDDWRGVLDRFIPESALGSAAMALLLTVPMGILATLLSITFLEVYGWGLFIALPFCLGLGAVLIYGYHERRSFIHNLAVSQISIILFGALLVVLAIEGLICVVMAAPVGGFLAGLGGLVGHLIQRTIINSRTTAALLVATFALVPLIMGVEGLEEPTPPLIPIESTLIIDAPPEIVWEHVIHMDELPEPEHWIFATGIAYPTHAEMDGEGVGAVRHCHFSTGPFIEPIHTWEPPRRLGFYVEEQPRSMDELTPFDEIEAPHVDNFLVSERGEFLLEELPDGRTKVRATTWYRHQIWPVAYWKVWSDEVIARIHMHVLYHVRDQAEAAG